MFVDFNKTFSPKLSPTVSIPDALISYLNKSLPHGIKYKDDGDGTCSIILDQGPVTISGFSFDFTEQYKEILGSNYTLNDIFSYSYNSQQPIPVKLNKKGLIGLNGQEVSIEKLKYNPYKPFKFVTNILKIVPSGFPGAFEINIGSENYSRKLKVSRVSNNSIHIMKFESKNEETIVIKYSLDEIKKSMTMSMSLNLKYAHSIRDIVESMSIYDSFINGNVYLSGIRLGANKYRKSSTKAYINSICFWKKVLEIENCLKTSFLPPKKDVDYDTACLVEGLYRNLIEGVPIRENYEINSLNSEWNAKTKDKLDLAIGKSLLFEFTSIQKLNLFGVTLSLSYIAALFNSKLSKYIVKEKECTFFLSNESNEKTMYVSKMLFKKTSDITKYRDKHTDFIKTFCEAKTANEYLT